MDAVFFSMKRAHLGGERLGRALLEPFGLTPARFDLMNTIVEHDGPMPQRGEVLRRAYDALINRGDATVHVDALITDHMDIDPATTRHMWTGTFFSMGARLGNRVRRNHDLYCWDIEEFYAWFTTPEERDLRREVPFVT